MPTNHTCLRHGSYATEVCEACIKIIDTHAALLKATEAMYGPSHARTRLTPGTPCWVLQDADVVPGTYLHNNPYGGVDVRFPEHPYHRVVFATHVFRRIIEDIYT